MATPRNNQAGSAEGATPEAAAARAHRRKGTGRRGDQREDAGRKTIVVRVTRRVKHNLYVRYVRISKKFYAHDEQGTRARATPCASRDSAMSKLEAVGGLRK